jgi:hypothetical protein
MPPQQQQGRSLREELEFSQWLMQFPALTVMVFLRRDLGYRLLNPLALIAVTGFLAIISILAQPDNADNQPVFLLLFALMAFIVGMSQRLKRWQELNSGVRQHSYYIGTSCFETIRWLPMFCRRNRRIARFIDPFTCMIIGVALFPVSRFLAMWLLFSGMCLRSFEYVIHQRERNRNLDLVDGLIISEAQGETVERFEESPGAQSQQPDPGIPTGLGPDIQEKIKHRKAKKHAL